MTIQEIRSDLRAIRYYYSKQKEFDKAAETVGESKVVETVRRYNQAVTNAPPRLYKVYVELYVHNNTQEAVSFDWDCCVEYIRKLNKQLCLSLLATVRLYWITFFNILISIR